MLRKTGSLLAARQTIDPLCIMPPTEVDLDPAAPDD